MTDLLSGIDDHLLRIISETNVNSQTLINRVVRESTYGYPIVYERLQELMRLGKVYRDEERYIRIT
jgi:hypothetical protein